MDRETFYRGARTDGVGALAGVRVVELTTTWAGPLCGCLLADFGADVVKVEHPDGEVARRSPPFLPGTDPPVSFMHATLNRNKRSLCLDLHHPDAREVFLRLAGGADIVVENFRPGTAEGWGVGYADVARLNPRVIYVSITGWGQWGPDADRPGYDPLAQAASGFLSLNGDPEGGPVKSPTFLADDLGGLHGALAALAALNHRARTGEGQHVDVSLLDALLFQSTGYPTLAAMGDPLPRMGNDFRVAAPARVFRTQDGFVMAGILLDSHWRRLAQLLARPELAEHPDYATGPARVAHREEVNALVAAWMAARTSDEVLTIFRNAGLPAAPVRTYAEAARDPHVEAREMLQPVALEDGTRAPLVGPAAKLSRTPSGIRRGPPALGADTEELLAELGYDEDARRRLRESGAL